MQNSYTLRQKHFLLSSHIYTVHISLSFKFCPTAHIQSISRQKAGLYHHSQTVTTASQLTNDLIHILSLQGAPSQGKQDKEIAMDSLALSKFPVYITTTYVIAAP